MPDSASNGLHAFIAPLGLGEFKTKFWPDEVFVIHGPLERLPPPFTNPEISNIHELFSRYSGRILFGKGTKGPSSVLMHNVNPLQLYNMGLSLYLPDIEPIVPGASDFLRELERELGLEDGQARMTAWASPSADGIACHLDGEEVFSIQLQGIKRFYVAEKKALISPVGMQFGPEIPPYADLYPQASDGFPDPKDFEFTEIVMKPGSVLFMPRGVWHRTEADQDSLSVSVILSPQSAAESLLRELRTLLLQDPKWRRPIYKAAVAGGLDRVERLLEDLPGVIKSIAARDLAPESETTRIANIQPDMRFQKIPDVRILLDTNRPIPSIQVNSDVALKGAAVPVPGLEVPAGYIPVLNWLEHQKRAFQVRELMDKFVDVSLGDHQKVLSYLAHNGFLKLLWFRPLGGVT